VSSAAIAHARSRPARRPARLVAPFSAIPATALLSPQQETRDYPLLTLRERTRTANCRRKQAYSLTDCLKTGF
jgi:hypothetical protein